MFFFTYAILSVIISVFFLQLSLMCLANMLPPTKVKQLFFWAAHIVRQEFTAKHEER